MIIPARLLLPLTLFLTLLATHISSHRTNRTHECIHDQLDLKLEVPELEPQSNLPGRVLATYANIRITFDFTELASMTNAAHKDYIINTLIPPSKRYLEAALKVIPLSTKLKRTSPIVCDTLTTPAIYQTTGVDADLVIFVTWTSEPTSNYLAFAGACVLSPDDWRPIFGKVNFNDHYLSPTTNEVGIRDDISTTLHEITHVLGFSKGLYQYFINPVTKATITGHVTTKLVNGQNIKVLDVEPLTTKVGAHFNCPGVEGAYLENEGGSGSAESHFERRIFFNEYMTASAISDSRITEFSLALLEGSGWYKPDYTLAEPFTFGKNKGCQFLDSPCLTPPGDTPAFPEYCNQNTQVGCSWTRRGISYCPYGTLDIDPFSDTCPIPLVFNDADCENVDDQPANAVDIHGFGSRCFTGTLTSFGVYCLKSTCVAQTGGGYTITVQVGTTAPVTVTCSSAGNIPVSGFAGKYLTCPDPTTFCGDISCKSGCFGRGTCVNKQCVCTDGWGSDDCTKKIYKASCTRCANGDPFKTYCYGDSCECDPSDLWCMCHLGLKTGAQCSTICVDGWSTTNCGIKEYKASCSRCASGNPFKKYCYGDSCECNPSDHTCMCRLNLKPRSECPTICVDGWDVTDCALKVYNNNCARCASLTFQRYCYGDSCECNPNDLWCMCHLGLKSGAECAPVCGDGWDPTDCTKKVYEDNCPRCANQDPFRTSCYGDSCECNPADLSCMCHLGLITGVQCSAICIEGWDPTDCSKKVYKMGCNRCIAAPSTPDCYGNTCAIRPVSLDPKFLENDEVEYNIGAIVGAVVGGIIILTGGIFGGIKLANHFALKRRQIINIKQARPIESEVNTSQVNNTQAHIYQNTSNVEYH